MPDEDKETKKQRKKEEKERKKQEKAEKKKAAAEQQENGEEGEERVGGKLVLFFVTILIIAIWLSIIAILIKTDVGGFGSSVLYPMLKDVPYVNKILPEPESVYEEEPESESPYGTMDDAVARIKELEKRLDKASANKKKDEETIADLQTQVDDLSHYKEEEAEFEKQKEKFYEEVVFSENAPDISQYRAYYEEIDPENAAILYKQVVEQAAYDENLADYVKTYSEMKAKDAASIFDTMTGNLGLVADILENMTAKSRADILSNMNAETAARLTEMLEPDSN